MTEERSLLQEPQKRLLIRCRKSKERIQEYIEQQQKKSEKQNDLGATIKRSVIERTKAKGYTIEK